LDVNRFARTTSWGHGFLAGYYERVLSPVGAGILVLALLLIAGWWSARTHPEHMPAIIWSALGALAMYGINQVAAKALVQARPYNVIKGVEVLVPRASSIGSPSGHAVVAGAVVCGLLLARCWRLALVALLAGLLLLFSEVYVGAAYPSQVGVAAAAGLLVVLVLWPLASRLLLPVVAAIGSSPFAIVVVSNGSLKRPPRRPAKQLAAPVHSRRMPDAKAMDALAAASEAARKATMGQGAGKGH
jgi:undecaprenyl-diphosphatase